MKIKWQERKVPWKRRPLYRILCCYLLNMCFEKKRKKYKKKYLKNNVREKSNKKKACEENCEKKVREKKE